jgi:hypothetical protein
MRRRDKFDFDRRQFMKAAALGLAGTSASGWFPALADQAQADPKRRRHCILLWMTGGPTQTDTFDMKPDHENGGEFKPIETSAGGLQISEHLPKLAQQADRLAVIRSLSTKEGDHGRGTYLMRTGHQPMGTIRYPTIGSSISKELGRAEDEMPAYVSVSPYRAFNQAAYSPGFLGPRYAPLTVGATDVYNAAAANAGEGYADLKVDNLAPGAGIAGKQFDERLALWRTLQQGFLSNHQADTPIAHDTVYQRAVRLMNSKAAKAFDLTEESDKVRDAYGAGRFGQGCLMARRLIEQGVSFVEVSLGAFGGGSLGWDTHRNNFQAVKNLSTELDAGWATLMSELDERGLLDSTTIIWMGEFGRTPKINRGGGRDHFPAAWSAVLAGGGIKGGQAYGKTSADGTTVEENKVDVGDVLATACQAIGISPDRQNDSEMGRPIRIAEGKVIKELLA